MTSLFLLFEERQLVAVLKHLFDTGSETTSTTLSWLFLYMATFPGIQRKLQKEIDDVVGTSRFCSLSDRTRYAKFVYAKISKNCISNAKNSNASCIFLHFEKNVQTVKYPVELLIYWEIVLMW